MRWLVRLGLPVVILAVLGAGLLPPVFDRGSLATVTLNAARQASLAEPGGSAAAYAAAAKVIAGHPGVTLISVSEQSGGSLASLGPSEQVKTTETVHTFMDKFPGLESWFHISSTQSSQLGF